MQNIDFSDHTVWRLLLTVGMKDMRATFLDTKTGRLVPYSSRTWQCDDADVLKNIEDAVYEDPMLLDDYDVSIFIRPKVTLFVPPQEYAGRDDRIAEALSLVDGSENKDIWSEPIGEALALYSTPGGVKGFLSRSFLTEDVHHALCPVVEEFTRKAAMAGGERMWVSLEENRLDVAAFREGRLLMANTWDFSHPADAAYYILYAWKTLEFSPSEAELSISGCKPVRDEIMPILRNYLTYVRLTMFPARITKALRDNISLPEALYRL